MADRGATDEQQSTISSPSLSYGPNTELHCCHRKRRMGPVQQRLPSPARRGARHRLAEQLRAHWRMGFSSPSRPRKTLFRPWFRVSSSRFSSDFEPLLYKYRGLWLTKVLSNGTYNATDNEVRFRDYTPARRDTTMLHRYATSGVPQTTAGWRAWRIRVTEDDVGAWMMHCHILAHMVMGT